MVLIGSDCCKCPQIWLAPQYATITAVNPSSGAVLWWEDRSEGGSASVSSYECAVNSFGIAESGQQTTGTSEPINTGLRIFDKERSPSGDVYTGTVSTVVRCLTADPLKNLFCFAIENTGASTTGVYFVDNSATTIGFINAIDVDMTQFNLPVLDGVGYFIRNAANGYYLATLTTGGTETTIVSERCWHIKTCGEKLVYIKSQDDGGTDYITVVVRDSAGNETEYQSTIDASTVTIARVGIPGASFFSVQIRTTNYTVWTFDSSNVASGPIVTASSLVVVNDSMAIDTTGDLIIIDNRRLRRYDTGGLVWSETSTTLFGDNYNIFDIDQWDGDILAIGKVGLAGDTFLARMQVDKTIDWQTAAPQAFGGKSAEEIVVDTIRGRIFLPHERVDK